MNMLEFLTQMVRDPARRIGQHIAAERGPSTNAPIVGGLYDAPGIGIPARVAGGVLNAAGLAQEPFNKVANAGAGEIGLLASLAQVKFGDPNSTATQAARLALNEGAAHPGRAIEALRTGPDSGTALLAGALEMASNPLNYAGGIGEAGTALRAGGEAASAAGNASTAATLAQGAGRALQGVGLTGEIVNRAGMLPLYLSPKGLGRLTEAPAFLRPVGREVSSPLAGALERLNATEAPPPLPRSPFPLPPPMPNERGDVPFRQLIAGLGGDGGRGLGPQLPPELGPTLDNLPPELGPQLPTRGNVPFDQLIPGIGKGGRGIGPVLPPSQDVPLPPELGPAFPSKGNARGFIGPILNPEQGPQLPPELGPELPTRGNVDPSQLIPGVGRNGGKGLGPERPIGPYLPLGAKSLPTPITMPPGAVTRAEERAARAVPDLIDNAAPTTSIDFSQLGGTREEALAQLSSDEVNRLVALAYPGETAQANALLAHPNPVELANAALERITRDNHALATLARTDDALARKLAYLPEPGAEAIQALPAAPGATADTYPAFLDLVRSVTGDLPLPTSDFYAKKLGVAAEDVPGLFKRAEGEGIIGELPMEPGRFAVKPSTFTPNVDIPATTPVTSAATPVIADGRVTPIGTLTTNGKPQPLTILGSGTSWEVRAGQHIFGSGSTPDEALKVAGTQLRQLTEATDTIALSDVHPQLEAAMVPDLPIKRGPLPPSETPISDYDPNFEIRRRSDIAKRKIAAENAAADAAATDTAATIARGAAAKADLFGDAADVAATPKVAAATNDVAAAIPDVAKTAETATDAPLEVLYSKTQRRKIGKTTSEGVITVTLQRQGHESWLNPELQLRTYGSGKDALWDVVEKTGSGPREQLVIAQNMPLQKARDYAAHVLQTKMADEVASPVEHGLAAQITQAQRAMDLLPSGSTERAQAYKVFSDLMDQQREMQIARMQAKEARVEGWRKLTLKADSGGDIAAGGGGGGGLGLLPYPGGLNGPVGRALLPALGGGITGAAAGAGIGAATDEENRGRGAFKGAVAGGLLGYTGTGAASMAGLDTAIRQALPKAIDGTMLDPEMHRAAIAAGLAAQTAAAENKGVKGVGNLLKAGESHWRASVVMTLKQLPQDALTRAFVMWGIAAKEFGATMADIRKWQRGLAQERATGVSMLDNPVTSWFRALGKQDKLTRLGDTFGVDFARSQVGAPDDLTGVGRSVTGGLLGMASAAKTVNPIAPIYGAVRHYFSPFVNAYIGFMNGIQHDAFRFALAEKALNRDVPRLADDFLFELARAGHNVKPLEGLGGRFSAEDVARVAGPQAAKDWGELTDILIEGQGNRIAFLGGDFRDKLAKDYTGPTPTGSEKALARFEQGIGRFVPFSRFTIRYAPVLAEIAIRHPRAALIAGRELQREGAEAKAKGKKAYQAGITITDKTPLVGLAARARNGGGEGSLTLDPLGALMPYGDLLSGGDELPTDATAYQKVVNLLGRVGFSPNPAVQAGAYIIGQDYRTPGNLSRTAGLESGVEAIPAGLRLAGLPVPDLPQLPSGRNLLDAGRNLLEPVTGEKAVAATDPVMRRYAELVMAQTGKPLNDKSNERYLLAVGAPSNDLWNLATVQARTSGAATNLTGMVSPIQTTAQTGEAAAAQRATAGLPLTQAEIEDARGKSPLMAPLMEERNRQYAAQHPEVNTYKVNDRGDVPYALLANWEASMKDFRFVVGEATYQRVRREKMIELGLIKPTVKKAS